MSDVRSIRIALVFGLVVLFTGTSLPAKGAASDERDQQPVITSFQSTTVQGGVVFSGTTTGCPDGTEIVLSGPGPIEGTKTQVGRNFSVFVPVEGGPSGNVGAIAVTTAGQMSTWVVTYLFM
jgi:hypothetical protein